MLVAFSKSPPTWVTEVLRQLDAGVHISVVPRLFELVTWQSQMEELHGLTVMDIAPPRLGLLNRAAKRCLDIVGSTLLLIALLPVMTVIAIAIKLTSPGPVFFRQDRVGYKGHDVQDGQVPDYEGRSGRREAGPAGAQRRRWALFSSCTTTTA